MRHKTSANRRTRSRTLGASILMAASLAASAQTPGPLAADAPPVARVAQPAPTVWSGAVRIRWLR